MTNTIGIHTLYDVSTIPGCRSNFGLFRRKAFQRSAGNLGGVAVEQEKCIINWESLQVFLDTVILDFSTLMVPVERYYTPRRFVMMTNGLDIVPPSARGIYDSVNAVYTDYNGVRDGRWRKSVEDNMTRSESMSCTKYFLVKWYWSEIINSWFGWMDATSISAGSFASCLLFWFYFLLFWLTGNSSSKMEHAEIKWIHF